MNEIKQCTKNAVLKMSAEIVDILIKEKGGKEGNRNDAK